MKPTPSAAVVRQWARHNGVAVGTRGRLSPKVLAAYAAAHEGRAEAAKRVVQQALVSAVPDRLVAESTRVSARPAPGVSGSTRRVAAPRKRSGSRRPDAGWEAATRPAPDR